MKEEMKKEEVKKEEVKEEIKVDENSIEETQSIERPRLLKSFKIEVAQTEAGKKLIKLFVTSLLDKEASMYLSETQLEVVNLAGLDNCYVDIEKRYSQKAKKSYYVIALHCGDEVFDLFVKDRAFVTLAKLHAKNVLGDNYPEI